MTDTNNGTELKLDVSRVYQRIANKLATLEVENAQLLEAVEMMGEELATYRNEKAVAVKKAP